ncbi:MAG TPA: cytochrome C biogenesis protein [Sulfurovum sp. UBA12169]|nr:MAG TPA: cytochrome C biogenesis protein [Sulfurovum sp. UBA12169]
MRYIFSMKMAVLMLFVFGFIIGAATFIENDYGTLTVKALIYKTKWFELFLAYFTAILVYNIFKYKTYKKNLAVFLFHFSFFVIAIGALITRYVGYEGIMHIREGQSVNMMVSDEKILEAVATFEGKSVSLEKPLYFSTMTQNSLEEDLDVGGKKIHLSLLKYLPTIEHKVAPDPEGKTILELKVSTDEQGKTYYFSKGDLKDFGPFYIGYATSSQTDKPTFLIKEAEDGFKVNFPFAMSFLKMDDKSSGEIDAGDHNFTQRILYRFGSNAIVLKSIHEKSKLETVSSSLKTESGKPEYIELKVSAGDQSREIVCKPMSGQPGELNTIEIDGVRLDLRIGAKTIEVPFAVKLEKFTLERYPGSMTPSSYASDVVLIDKEQNLTMPYKIYMNHILDHRNYRFFQSSYDMDEKGTILSVNHDPGTLPTYVGYFLMTLGMVWSLFLSNGRFQKLLKGARKLQGAAVSILLALMIFNAADLHAKEPEVDPAVKEAISAYDSDHAQKMGKLAVQDYMGRMKPLDTVAHEVVAKITGKSAMFGLEPMQVLLGMITQPEVYQNVPMIKIGHKKIALTLGLPEDAKFAQFSDFFSKEDNSYKIYDAVSDANRKKPLDQSTYDKELIKIDERVNVSYMVYQGTILRIYPQADDVNNKWAAPLEAIKTFESKTRDLVTLSVSAYFQSVAEGLKTGSWTNADLALKGIVKYQKTYGAAVLPSERHIDMEIAYNKLGLFGKLVPLYLLVGLAMLVFAFIHVLKPTFSMKWIMRGALGIFVFGFIMHMIGLGIRWYIAGHAPWSNAYESIVFIAASTALAGILLARHSPFALAGTALLAGITMGVAHMSFINPEITNLVPVLKSYWLMIHVATIISGDGFLGLGSILSLLVLILFIVRGEGGHKNIDRSIKELTNLSEMALIVGLFLLTIGNFLGGVWANESWGRYWGWDPKETWAAVTILIYAAVLHMRFIPALRSIFLYNVVATWAYSTVLMTYFGVNYYLSGLHSYAAGDPVPIPMWVYYAITGLFVLTLLAARNKNLENNV